MRVLLTGASGLLGYWLRRTTPDEVELIAVEHRNALTDGTPSVPADLRDPEETHAAIRDVAPDLVLHAAYARDRASILDATRNVARAGTDLVHISTEAVFAGDGRIRAETDEPDPVWDYGRWKAAAEQAARDLVPESAIVRPPLLVSLDPPDAGTERLLHAAQSEEPVPWYADERRQAAWAAEVASAVWRIAALTSAARAGFWHLPGPEILTRYELAERTAEALGLESLPGSGARRPAERDAPRDLRLGADRAHRAIRWDPTPIRS